MGVLECLKGVVLFITYAVVKILFSDFSLTLPLIQERANLRNLVT